MIKKIKGFFKETFQTTTLRQSVITFSGTFVNGVLGAIFYIISARFLGPSSFGLFILAVTTLTLISDISDLGINTGIVRFVAKYFQKDEKKAYQFLKLGLEVKFLILVFTALFGWIVSPFIAKEIFNKPEFDVPLKISFIGVSSSLLFSFIISALQSLQKFWSWSLIQIAANLLRLILVFLLIWLGKLTTNSNLVVYVLVPFLGFVFGMKLIGTKFLDVKNERSVTKKFFSYNKWVAALSLISALGSRMDTFISGKLLSNSQLGIYSAANQLVQVVPQLVSAVGTVIAPKMAGMEDIKNLVSYMKKVQIMVLGLAMLGILIAPVIIFMIPLIYGKMYTPSIPVFVILLFAMLIFLISVPVHVSVFYYFSKPSIFFWLSLVHLTLVSVLSFSLIPVYGIIGASLSVLAGQILNFVVPLFWVLRKIKKSLNINH